MRAILLTILTCALLLPATAGATPPLLKPIEMTPIEGVIGATPLQAKADKVHCKVRFVHALKKGEDDQKLAPIRKRLKAVAKEYNAFKQIGQADLNIPQGETRTAAAPNKSTLSVKFIEKLLKGKKQLRLRMQIQLPPRLKNSIATISNGSTWPGIRVSNFRGGELIVALTCTAK